MIALSKLAIAMLGASTQVSGLACGPNSPAALNVIVGPGEIYSLQNIDNTAYSSLAADTAHTILKQGVLLDAVTLATPAPVTGGQSINYLIQAAFAETDSGAVVLPYYNASNPATAYSGPAGAGTTNNTVRKGACTVTAKAGIAATSGTQTTPAPDAGNVGLYVVTVANGQSTVLSGNIAALATAPFIAPLSAYAKIISAGTVVGTVRNARMSVATASASATFTADEVVLETALGGTPYRLASFSGAINLASTGAGGMDTGAAPASGYVALYAIYNPATGVSALLATNATAAAAPNVYAGAAMPAGYTASALVSVLPTNAGGQFLVVSQLDRKVYFPPLIVINTTVTAAAGSTISVAGSAPKNAVTVSGSLIVTSTATSTLSNLVSGNAARVGEQGITTVGTSAGAAYNDVPLLTQQVLGVLFSSTAGTPQFSVYFTAYTF